MSAIINSAAYADGRRVKSITLDEISEVLKQPDVFVWIGLHEPDEELLKQIQDEFQLHELAVEDAHRAHQRPKIEAYGSSMFIVLRTAQENDTRERIDFGETHFFVGKNYLVSVRHGSSLAYSGVRQRCESTPHLLRKGPGFALYAVMDSIVDQYFPVVDCLEAKLEALEEQIFDQVQSREATKQIHGLKRELLEIKRAVSPLIDICNRLMRFELDIIPEDTRPYFRDVYDHAIRINEMVDNLRELLTSALEANLSLISISQNDDSRRFAAWAAIIAVPTMIAGIYGMNFEFMPELHWSSGYFVVLGGTFVLCIFLYYRFKRSGWL